MFFSVDTLDLVLYCVQQVGVMLAVGAESIVLISYLLSMRDGKIEETEARFSRAVHRALGVGVLLMVLSGIAIMVLEASLGQIDVVLAPVFLFKWLLIIGLICTYIWQRGKPFSHYLIEGVIGGTWYTLFLVHILAPLTGWINLITLYVLMLGGFLVIWAAFVKLTREKSHPLTRGILPSAAQAPMPKPAQPKSIAAVAPSAPVPAAIAPHHSLFLPAIHVMPESQKQLEAGGHITTLSGLQSAA